MGLFSKPEVVVLKDTCDSREFLYKLQKLRASVPDSSHAAEKIDKEIAVTEAGIYGEDSILFELKNSGMNLVVIRDLFIQTQNGRTAQIDFFVITPYANVIIECKNLFGNIEINNKGDFIRTFNYKGHYYKEGIYSPITQNERHLDVYKDCWEDNKGLVTKLIAGKFFADYNKTIVVLANPKTVVNDKFAKKEIKQQVIRCDQLVNYLKALKTDDHRNLKAMRESGERVLAMNIQDRTDYLNKFKEFEQEVKSELSKAEQSQDIKKTEDNTTLKCPRCGGQLVLRVAKKGENAGNKFYGCNNYPKCRYIQNL
ncbi:nuclease-related domain-containing protein [Butyrivibrio sp. XB500-5]|uniref:nuclease-related domain-containing protein n=1 Tax=Butyrivibrio sp. XB500-5 TaxID=2364880 RepID=UPI0013144AEB|nr:nuclease-related domain-containing protein [Butyrivibrio sp. XB500-5]